ncbi:bifunctional adenosylcobinamide kinase/adenosylcobinamide-phosphate guanylyltransferase [Lichenibacterium minor]|uniref:Bifunctional adenosylcobalamin biosynthesis protein n=1 Tax=Lichenibacterium minor TaxID=2316528 RepID=A0A4Q2U5X3_9HYPH|nr:bifunctional adenosylcobinamide kinase/adenosylcobinamide-phosphate guanylyltransferase [Lichenibacterium minor]RYC31989.1 bifunctional adenosylcobinamide kinase/adenosylcobinamide-phosphate guanylyltransferase [Lichenibacterium minor]
MSFPHTLVLGGARSGKSRHAEALARGTGLERVYLATATAWDGEMRDRIARHRDERAADGWRTVEEPLALAAAMEREAAPGRVLLVDCLTLWLTNVMLGAPPDAARSAVEAACAALAAAVPALAGPAVLVSNEVGWGIVPDNRLARDFRDAQGRLNQHMAESCGRVVLVAAGLPLTLKGTPA